jgi:hypothetical protein
MLTGNLSRPSLLSIARMLATMLLARWPSSIMRFKTSRISSWLQFGFASKRKQIPPFVTSADSAWLISCAIEAAIASKFVEFLVDGGNHTRLAFLQDGAGKATSLVLNRGPWQIAGQRIN